MNHFPHCLAKVEYSKERHLKILYPIKSIQFVMQKSIIVPDAKNKINSLTLQTFFLFLHLVIIYLLLPNHSIGFNVNNLKEYPF